MCVCVQVPIGQTSRPQAGGGGTGAGEVWVREGGTSVDSGLPLQLQGELLQLEAVILDTQPILKEVAGKVDNLLQLCSE